MINEEIRDKEVRMIDQNGDQLGIMPIKQALELAELKQLDLVKIAPQAKPPVCKIMDYGKHRFEIAKKEKEAKKNQKVIIIKEVRLSPTIEEHDLGVKAKNAIKFLESGDKVKVTIRFKGRQMNYTQSGMAVMDSFSALVGDICTIEKKPRVEGRSMIMILTPKN